MQRCLIIDGSPIIRKVTKTIMGDFGFEVVEASTARDGLAMFNRHIPRLALVDASLADMKAMDVVRQMRTIGGSRVLILYCTTEFDLATLQLAQASGANDVLVKPFDRPSLAGKLNAWPDDEPGQRPSFYSRLSRSEIVRIS